MEQSKTNHNGQLTSGRLLARNAAPTLVTKVEINDRIPQEANALVKGGAAPMNMIYLVAGAQPNFMKLGFHFGIRIGRRENEARRSEHLKSRSKGLSDPEVREPLITSNAKLDTLCVSARGPHGE